MKKFLVLLIVPALLFAVQTGCDSGSDAEECEVGATQSCLCEGEMIAVGIQTCDEDGKWSECECGAGQQDAAADDGEGDGDTEPAAVINADPVMGTAPLDVSFAATVLGGNEPFTYAWDFGDGNTSTEQAPNNTYTDSGTYTVILTVTDADGDTAADTVDIHVGSNSEPAVEIVANPAAGVEPLTVQFSASVVGGNEPFAYEWDLDDDGTADAAGDATTHVFQEGTYTVSLTVTDEDGDTSSDSIDIEVTDTPEKPEAVATASHDCVLPDREIIQLDGTGSSDPNGDELTYQWVFVRMPPDDDDTEFDDPNIANPTFEADEEGTYEVQLFVSDGTHRVGSEILTIVASESIGDIEIIQGSDQTAEVNDTFPEKMIIEITNECGIPLPNARVRVTGMNAYAWDGADCEGGTICTSSGMDGRLSFWGYAGYRAGAPGSITVINGCHTATFDNLEVTAGEAAMLLLENPKNHPTANGKDTAVLTFQLYDWYMNPVTGPDVQFGLELDYGPNNKDFGYDPTNDAWFLDAGVTGICEGEYCWNLETTNGTKTGIQVAADTTWPVFVRVYDVSVIEDVDDGPDVGSHLFGGARYLWETGFETGDTELEPSMGPYSQWEVGRPTASDGPSGAHTGSRVLGTNLDGDYEVITEWPDMDIDIDSDADKIVSDLDIDSDSDGAFVFTDFADFDFDYYEYTYMMGMFVDFWHWYDMRGNLGCTECTAASGQVQSYYDGSYYLLRPHGNDEGAPYPGPGICVKEEEENKRQTYFAYEYGWGGQQKSWKQVHMRYYEFDYFGDLIEKAPWYNWYGYGDLKFAFHTSDEGEADGAGWYIDDLRIQGIAGQGAITFDNTNVAAYTDLWQQSGVDYNGTTSPDAGPCMDYNEPARVHAVVYDENDNRIMEPGINVEFTLADAGVLGKGAGTGTISEVLRGSLVSQSGGVTTVATDEDGVIRLSIQDTVPGSYWVRSELSGVSNSMDEESISFTEETFYTGDCCEDTILLNGGTPGTYLSGSAPTYIRYYHGIEGSCLSSMYSYLLPDVIFEFKVSEDGLYYMSIPCCSYYFELRMGNNCPGTPVTSPDIDYNCFGGSMYAYLYEGETYYLIGQNSNLSYNNTPSVSISREYSGGE